MKQQIRAVENELDTGVYSFSTGRYSFCMSYPRHARFDSASPTNGPHRHEVYEVCLCTSGEGVFETEAECLTVHAGQVFLGVPGIAHEIRVEPGQQLDVLFFVFRITPTSHPLQPADAPVESFLTACRTMGEGDALAGCDAALLAHGGRGAGLGCLLQSMALDFLEALSQSAAPRTDREKLEALLNSTPGALLSVGCMARTLSMSQRSLYYYFKKEYGITPLDYIHRRRMEAAQGFLRMGMSVRETSELLGFSEPSSFCRLFRRWCGLTPAGYRSGAVHREGEG